MCDALMFTRLEFMPSRPLLQDLQHLNPTFSWHGTLDYLRLEIFTTTYSLTASSSYRAVDVWDLLHVTRACLQYIHSVQREAVIRQEHFCNSASL